MKIGLVSAILADYGFEKMIDAVAALGLDCVEVACWPAGKAERRYAGVSHINAAAPDKARIWDCCAKKGVTISALAYYPNTLDGDPQRRAANVAHLKRVIEAAAELEVGMVTTFIGRDQRKSVEENLDEMMSVWPGILALAEERGVRVAIENCPMLFGRDQWPGGQNLMTTPAIWREVFDRLPSPNLGINYDPSHFVWQMMDYIAPIYSLGEKLFHVHFKDIKLYRDRLDKCGIMAYPLDYMAPKLPGLGDVDWGRFCSALTDVGYDGCACIEVEDRAFEGSEEAVLRSIRQSRRYLGQFVG